MLKTQEQQTAGRSKAVASVATILVSMNPVLEFKNSTLNFLILFVNSSREYYRDSSNRTVFWTKKNPS